MTPLSSRLTRSGVTHTTYSTPDGHSVTLVHDWDFATATAEYSHHDERSVTYRDGYGHYARVARVRNPVAWLRRHGLRADAMLVRTPRPPRSSALERAASAVGLVVERYGDGSYWVSGLEKWRSETWVRREVARRVDEQRALADAR